MCKENFLGLFARLKREINKLKLWKQHNSEKKQNEYKII